MPNRAATVKGRAVTRALDRIINRRAARLLTSAALFVPAGASAHFAHEYSGLVAPGRLQGDGRMLKLAKFLWRWGPALLIMALIFFASGTKGSDLPEFGFLDQLVKKGGHMLGYGLLAAAYLRGLTGTAKAGRGTALLAMLMAALYAATDEYHQSFTPGRSPSVADVGIDTIGAVLGAAASAWIHARR